DPRALRGAGMHRAPIEPQLISRSDARPEGGQGAIDRQPAGTDPGLRFAPRCETGTREHLLHPLGVLPCPGTRSARGAARVALAAPAGSFDALLIAWAVPPARAPHQPSNARGPATSSAEPPPSAESSSSSGGSSAAPESASAGPGSGSGSGGGASS